MLTSVLVKLQQSLMKSEHETEQTRSGGGGGEFKTGKAFWVAGALHLFFFQ